MQNFLMNSLICMKYLVAFIFIFSLVFYPAMGTFATEKEAPKSNLEQENFKKWVIEFKKIALKDGKISEQTFDKAFENIKYNPKVIHKDKNQPEFMETFWTYYKKRLTKQRIMQGINEYKKYTKLLSEIEKKYGVPGQYIIAFWGLETSYGHYFGNWNVIKSLALLAYDGRRKHMFERELITALQILENNKIDIKKMVGSWSGAMGNFQFMPSTYQRYAIDGDGDEIVDMWGSIPDAFNSAANYLSKVGWKRDLPWGEEVMIPDDFDWMLIGDYNIKKSKSDWQKLGIKKAFGEPLDNLAQSGYLLAPQGKSGPVFLLYDNFDIIMKWNLSYNYAILVGMLADSIKDPNTKIYALEVNEELLRQKIAEIQKELYDMKIYEYKDFRGVLNNKTRMAIRRYQKEYGLTPDGYPSTETYLHILDKGTIK